MKFHLFRSIALTGFLVEMENLDFFVGYLVHIFERLVNQEKMRIYFLKSLLSQALWVAGK